MATRFERHVRRRTECRSLAPAERLPFGVGGTEATMPPLPDDPSASDQNTTDHRVRFDPTAPADGERQGPSHEQFVVFVGVTHGTIYDIRVQASRRI